MTGRFDLDSLARAASTTTSRRQLAKLTASAALASMLPWSVRPAQAKTTGTCPAQARQTCFGTRDVGGSRGVTTSGCASVGGKRVASGTPSTFNGCGPQGGIDLPIFGKHDPIFGDHNVIPDSPFELANFFNACKAHDCCYGKCGADKATCDGNFLLNMEGACQAEWPGTGVLDSVGLSYCLTVARVYFDAVSGTQTGTDAYNAGQDEVCDCCVDCKTAFGLGNNGACSAQYALTCPDPNTPGEYRCVDGCADSENCGACGQTCPPRDNGDGSTQRGCCQDGRCVYDPGCLNYCSCWEQTS